MLSAGALDPMFGNGGLVTTDFLGPALPVRLSRGDRGTAPAEPLGASSEAVLGELLLLPEVEIARLREAGALG